MIGVHTNIDMPSALQPKYQYRIVPQGDGMYTVQYKGGRWPWWRRINRMHSYSRQAALEAIQQHWELNLHTKAAPEHIDPLNIPYDNPLPTGIVRLNNPKHCRPAMAKPPAPQGPPKTHNQITEYSRYCRQCRRDK